MNESGRPKNPDKMFSFDHAFWSHDGFEDDGTGYFRPTTPKYTD